MGAALLTAASFGCSRQSLVVGATAPLIDAAMEEIYTSGDIETAREGIPGQILLLRGLCRSDPGRLDVWTSAVQLYTSYAMIFIEDRDPDWALDLYDEGRDLGLRFLRRKAWFARAWDAGPDSLRAEIARRHPRELGPLMLWTGACLGQHVVYNQDHPREMLDFPFVHVLIDAAIELDGGYFHGMPYAVKGMILAMMPRGLGGNLAESNRYFQMALEASGHRFLLHQVLYARRLCVASLDEDCFVRTLEGVLAAPEDERSDTRFVNLLARQRARELLERRADFF